MSATVVRLPERPFPIMWEQSPERDECPHDWEEVYAEARPGVFVEVGRCAKCHTPRCDRLDEHKTQCVERRHHRDLHIFESGTFDPVRRTSGDSPPLRSSVAQSSAGWLQQPSPSLAPSCSCTFSTPH